MSDEADVADMAQQISRVVKRDGWTSDKSVVPDMQRLLSKLTTLQVDMDLLQRTKIGAAVNKLKKHDDEMVRGYSSTLTKKWKSQVGLGGSKASSTGVERPPQRVPSASPPKRDAADAKRFENARKRLQEGYASEKAKRESRTVQVLTRPVAKGRRGTTISAAPSRSSIGRAQLAQRRRLTGLSSAPSQRASSAPPTARRVIPVSRVPSQARRPAPSRSPAGIHRQRQLKLRALSGQPGGQPSGDVDRRAPEQAPSNSRSSRPQVEGRARSGSRPSRASAPERLPPAPDARKAMLDKMFPRVCGVAAAPTSSKSSGGAQKSRTPTATARRKAANYSEGQREVLAWLKGLSVDMSEYAPAFFENGFDSVKLLSTIEKSDLPALVPKKGHHRLIQQALDDLRRKHSTSATSQQRERPRKESSRGRRPDPFSEEDSDDSFVVSDDGEYSPGYIAAMFRKNRK
ncbi:hypothetical protein BBJ28_00006504, partial [Nothophytophthora sp. Chile5]